MPGIRDEEWALANSPEEGIQFIREGLKDVRFSGLMMNNSPSTKDYAEMITALTDQSSQCKALSLDWFDFDHDGVTALRKQIEKHAESVQLDLIRMNQTNLNTKGGTKLLRTLVSNQLNVRDLHLALCRLNNESMKYLGKALKSNNFVVSLNLNHNYIAKQGFLTLAKDLSSNKVLRYFEAKANRATYEDYVEFITALDGNTHIEFIDVGQWDDVDGKITQNPIDEKIFDEPEKLDFKDDNEVDDIAEDIADVTITAGTADAGAAAIVAVNNGNNLNVPSLVDRIKTFTDRNVATRKQRETALKLQQLRTLLNEDLSNMYASLKHCKVVTLGEKGVGKTFSVHCLMHRLYNLQDKTKNLPALTTARMSELGWTKIPAFDHVEMVLAKYISNIEENKRNRMLANETLFQFSTDVVISENEVALKKSVLRNEHETALQRISKLAEGENADMDDEVQVVEGERQVESAEQALIRTSARRANGRNVATNTVNGVMSQAEVTALLTKMENKIDATIEKAMREHNYPSFSVWDMEASTTYDELFPLFINNHGIVMVFFNVNAAKADPKAAIRSIRKYLSPIIYDETGSNFTSKIMIVGTHFDLLCNAGSDAALQKFIKSYNCKQSISLERDGYFKFIIERLDKKSDTDSLIEVGKFLVGFNDMLRLNLGLDQQTTLRAALVENDEMGISFFPLGNELPDFTKTIKEDFDDLTGMNRLRKKVKVLVRSDSIRVLDEMVSLRSAKVVDLIIQRKNYEPPVNATAPTEVVNKDYMTLGELKKMARNCGITSYTDLVELLNYLHETGIIFWLNHTEKLRNLIILNPVYIVSSLSKFYESIANKSQRKVSVKDGLEVVEFEQYEQLLKEAGDADLREDLNSFIRKNIASHDLLIHSFISKVHFDYFFDLLGQVFSLNKIDLYGLNETTKHHDLVKIRADEEVYLVSSNKVPLPSTAELTDHTLFSEFRVKFIPRKGRLARGMFQRIFSIFVDALKTESIQSEMKDISFKDVSAKIEFDQMTLTMKEVQSNDPVYLSHADLKSQAEVKESGYILFQFSNEKALSVLFGTVVAVMRKIEAEMGSTHYGFGFLCLIHNKGTFVDLKEAREKRIAPYFNGNRKDGRKASAIDAEDILGDLLMH